MIPVQTPRRVRYFRKAHWSDALGRIVPFGPIQFAAKSQPGSLELHELAVEQFDEIEVDVTGVPIHEILHQYGCFC
jgi:hypothetical protein